MGADLNLAGVQDFLLGSHGHSFVLVECGPAESVFGELLLHVDCILADDLKVFILQAFGNLKQDQKTLLPDLSIRVLQKVDDMLRDPQIKACFDLV